MNNTTSNHSRPPVDWNRPLITRDGRPFTLLPGAMSELHKDGGYTRRGKVEGLHTELSYTEKGHYWRYGDSDYNLDLFNVATTKEATLDIMKPMQTFDGRPVELLSVDMVEKRMVVRVPGIVGDTGYHLHGRFFSARANHPLNLRNTPTEEAAPPPSVFDPNKPVRCRNGRKARIICRDRKGEDERTLIVLVTNEAGTGEFSSGYFNDGCIDDNRSESEYDLINL